MGGMCGEEGKGAPERISTVPAAEIGALNCTPDLGRFGKDPFVTVPARFGGTADSGYHERIRIRNNNCQNQLDSRSVRGLSYDEKTLKRISAVL